METLIAEDSAQIASCFKDELERNKEVIAGGIVVCLVFALTMCWFHYDHRVYSADEAGHVLNSIAAGDLLLQTKPWHYEWWLRCLSVSNFYPPFAYFVNGALIKLVANTALGAHLGAALFMSLLSGSVYAIARLSCSGRLAASLAAGCISIYPVIAGLGHSAFLDLPATAMVALSIAAALWWRRSAEPRLLRTLCCAVIVALACLTKQSAIAFLAPVFAYFVAKDLYKLVTVRSLPLQRSLNRTWLLHDLYLMLLAGVLGAPFFLINYRILNGYLVINTGALAHKGIHETFATNFVAFAQLLPDAVSPMLALVFVGYVIQAVYRRRLDYLPVWASALGGLSALSLSSGIVHDYRYVMPALIAPALCCGSLCASALSSSRLWVRLIALNLTLLLVYNYFATTFTPTPLRIPALPWNAKFLYYQRPVRELDWGYDSVIERVEESGEHNVLLNVLVNSDYIHINGYRLRLADKHNFNILPWGSRTYTIAGDQVAFSQDEALKCGWYVWKTGPTGYMFYDDKSKQNYEKLVNFVVQSGNYDMVLKRMLPDNTELMLFQRRR